MMVGHHFRQLAEDSELPHEQSQFYLSQALQKCTCTYKRRTPFQQPEQNNTLRISVLECLSSETSIEYYSSHFRQFPIFQLLYLQTGAHNTLEDHEDCYYY